MASGRISIRRLLLLNWRGVFYQPFDFARGITALEGHNGAGKTTVMVALFVALLPDLRLLSFRNVGESVGENDKGIYGRLGRPGPAYTLIEFMTPEGDSLWAGVMLTRHGEPRLELTPFLIDGLAGDMPLESVFLRVVGDQELIPTLPELKEQVAMTGGALKSQDSVTAYLGELYERSVLPLPLANHDERERFHRVLATSMMGGLSAFIQKGLRDYLLPEDIKLRSHVGRMRENLDACRLTRRQIQDARVRYESIRRVYDAGWGMVVAAFHGTRLRAQGQRKVWADSFSRLRTVRTDRERAKLQQSEAQRRHEMLQTELESRQAELHKARAHAENAQRAFGLAREIERAETRVDELRGQWEGRRDQLAFCEQQQASAYAAYADAQGRRDELAAQLADAQTAFEDLHRRVAELRAARQSLQDARGALPGRQLDAQNAHDVRKECEQNWQQSLAVLESAKQAQERHGARKRRFDEALAALERLADSRFELSEVAASARHWDERYRERAALVKASAHLEDDLRHAEARAERQSRVRERARQLQLTDSQTLRIALQEAQGRQGDLIAKIQGIDENAARQRETIARCDERLPQLERRHADWQSAQQLAAELTGIHPFECTGEEEVAELERRLAVEAQTARDSQRRHETEASRLESEAEQLAFGGGRIDESLVALGERLGGQLLSERFEDVAESVAGRLEARLGPLAAAIVVDDPLASARLAGDIEPRPDTVWFVSPDALLDLESGESVPDGEIVQGGTHVRLTRQPSRPVVGRLAREHEISRLREAACEQGRLAESEARRAHRAYAARALAARLVPLTGWLGTASPEAELDRTKLERRRAATLLEELVGERLQLSAQQVRWQERSAALAELAPDAALLDAPIWVEEAEKLRLRIEEVKNLGAWLEAHRSHWEGVQKGYQDLLDPPDPADLARLVDQARDAQAVLDTWQRARELLRILCERLPSLRHEADEQLLAQKEGVLTGLRARHREVEAAVADAKRRWDAAQDEHNRTQAAHNEMDALYKTASAELAGRERELAEIALRGTAEETDQAQARLAVASEALKQGDAEEREADKAVDRATQQVRQLERSEERELAEVRRQLRETRPVWWQWVALKKEANAQGLFGRLQASRIHGRAEEEMSAAKSFNAAAEFTGELKSILAQVDGGSEVLHGIEAPPPARGDGARGMQNLRAWREVRSWIDQRIPRDIAQAREPEQALAQIHDHLSSLESRLAGQESSLRQRTEEVANSIASKIRREEQRLHRINQGLADVRFGAIRGVRLNLTRLPTFQAMLDALRSNPDLFSGDMPLELAMAQLFEQIGGGRIRGEQLLDYREYLRLSVQIRRIGLESWADARGLSTGESIGVGASILIVILDAWEHQAALLRGRRSAGSLRFLFLDEATRLDADALDTLTDFCERVGVQLLVAAPGLERARRGHVYSLVRSEQDGDEVVLVRGRKWAE